ncbi:MAG: hypothetical protein ACFFAS_06375 [Promethearchaeota archaeon]
MENILSSLNLSKEAIEVYLKISGQNPLSREEIIENNQNLPSDKVKEIINTLLELKLLTNIMSDDSKLAPRFLPLPPFAAIYQIYGNIEKEDTEEYKIVGSKIESLVSEILEETSKTMGLDSIIEDITELRNNFGNESSEIRNEVEEIMKEMQTRDDSALYYLEFEDSLKEVIHSKFASVLEIILQIENIEDNPLRDSINSDQWIQIKSYLKNILAKNVHKKTLELDARISQKFNELKNYFASKLAISMEEQFGQNVINLGILKIIIDEINQLIQKLSKKKELNKKLSKINTIARKKIFLELNNFNRSFIDSIKQIENFLPAIIENYFKNDEFWQITSEGSIREEITKISQDSSQDIVIIIPKISGFLDLNFLQERKNKIKLKIIASDAHDSEMVTRLKTFPNIEYFRIEKNKIILIKGEAILILGYSKLKENEVEITTRGIAFTSKNFIELLEPIVPIMEEQGQLPVSIQINKNFNLMLNNINNFKGKKLGRILQKNLDILSKIEGISLKLLELKLIANKLKGIQDQLNNDFKNDLIDKITLWNEDLTGLPLNLIHKGETSTIEEELDPDRILDLEGRRPFEDEEEQFGNVDQEKIEPLFDILLEEVDKSNALELSNQIQNAINTLMQIQGYSIITTWKDSLKGLEDNNKILDSPYQEKLREDITRWKAAILNQNASYKTRNTNVRFAKQTPDEDIDLRGYVSPGLMQGNQNGGETSLEVTEIESISKEDLLKTYFDKITEGINKMTGVELSKILQDIGDTLIETHGYMATKEVRPLINKVKTCKKTLDEDLKSDFITKITELKQKYIPEELEDTLGDYTPSFVTITEDMSNDNEVSENNEETELSRLIDKVLEDVNTLEGYKLTDTLQEIADIIMQTKGSLAARAIRPWVNKIRAIREPLDEKIKKQFIDEFEQIKSKNCE